MHEEKQLYYFKNLSAFLHVVIIGVGTSVCCFSFFFFFGFALLFVFVFFLVCICFVLFCFILFCFCCFSLHSILFSKGWKAKIIIKKVGASKPKGLNRMAKIGKGHLYQKEENLSFNNNDIIISFQ